MPLGSCPPQARSVSTRTISRACSPRRLRGLCVPTFRTRRQEARTGTNAASASGIKSIDIAFNIEGLFLGLGLSVKAIGMPERDRGYTHNFKRVSEEWVLETLNYHRYMPYAIIIGMLFLPEDAMRDRKRVTSLATAIEHFAPFREEQIKKMTTI